MKVFFDIVDCEVDFEVVIEEYDVGLILDTSVSLDLLSTIFRIL